MCRLLFACVVFGSSLPAAFGQELYFDIWRTQIQPAKNGVTTTMYHGGPNFKTGFLETTGQPFYESQVEVAGSQGVLINPNFFISHWNSNDSGFILGSSAGWNLTSNTISDNGRNYAAGTVTVHAVDRIPAFELQHVNINDQYQSKFNVAVAPLSGASTPGRLIMLTRASGVWSQVYDIPINGAKTDNRVLNVKGITHFRWLIVKNSGSTANVSATLKIIIEAP